MPQDKSTPQKERSTKNTSRLIPYFADNSRYRLILTAEEQNSIRAAIQEVELDAGQETFNKAGKAAVSSIALSEKVLQTLNEARKKALTDCTADSTADFFAERLRYYTAERLEMTGQNVVKTDQFGKPWGVAKSEGNGYDKASSKEKKSVASFGAGLDLPETIDTAFSGAESELLEPFDAQSLLMKFMQLQNAEHYILENIPTGEELEIYLRMNCPALEQSDWDGLFQKLNDVRQSKYKEITDYGRTEGDRESFLSYVETHGSWLTEEQKENMHNWWDKLHPEYKWYEILLGLLFPLTGCSPQEEMAPELESIPVPSSSALSSMEESSEASSEGMGKIPGTSVDRVSREQVTSSDVVLDEYGTAMTINATYVYQKLLDAGWTHEAICAILGNMQTESYLNPGKGEDGNSKTGFGLLQWTPYGGVDYYGDWADSHGLTRDDIDTQLKRILAEVNNPSLPPVQWSKKYQYPNYGMSFSEFTQSDLDISYLTEVFMGTHEGPEISTNHLDRRQKYALYWDNYFR